MLPQNIWILPFASIFRYHNDYGDDNDNDNDSDNDHENENEDRIN